MLAADSNQHVKCHWHTHTNCANRCSNSFKQASSSSSPPLTRRPETSVNSCCDISGEMLTAAAEGSICCDTANKVSNCLAHIPPAEPSVRLLGAQTATPVTERSPQLICFTRSSRSIASAL